MHSVADELRAESRRRVAALPPADRVALALALGDDDVALLATARGITPVEARAAIAAARAIGRRFSASNAFDRP
jgi:hypothetical protein